MKNREKELLTYILEHGNVGIQELMNYFSISKRTLYYDIESLNFLIRGNGQIKNINHRFCYIGNARSLKDIIDSSQTYYLNNEERIHYILYKILQCEKITIEQLAEEMMVSKNTVVQNIDSIRKYLVNHHLQLVKTPFYEVYGNEERIRNLFLMLMQEDNNILNIKTEEVTLFDQKNGLHLTDYALASLAKFISFVKSRCEKGAYISRMAQEKEIQQFPYYHAVKELLGIDCEEEQLYMCAYIASLSSLDTEVINPEIDRYVDILMKRFEAASAICLDVNEEFKKNIRHHLVSSYYRIKYRFPIHNPVLQEIKQKHQSLFLIMKRILENDHDFPAFKGIREEEIGFISAYFGGYLKGSDKEVRKNKVLLVCPHGLMVSKSLEVQLYRYIPTIQIVDTIALKDLNSYQGIYDYIISTIDIPKFNHVIVVNPMLTRFDIDHIIEKLLHISSGYVPIHLDEIIKCIKQNADIKDETRLRRELEVIIYKKKENKEYQPMLKELINEKRIQVVDQVQDWKEAIQVASQPLLMEKTIDQVYVDAMIESVEEHGPYIVLADNFALPHASSASGVNQLSMALLVVKNPVDLKGKSVRLFMVLATTDNKAHMKALASLSEILFEPKNIELFCRGEIKEILSVIRAQD